MTSGRRNSSAPFMPMQALPAAPGFFVISPVFDPDKTDKLIDIHMQEVIGWALDRDSLQPYPITLEGVDEDMPSILKPSGKIDRLGLESYDSIVQWIADLRHTTGRKFS